MLTMLRMTAPKYAPIAGVRVVGVCGHARHGKDEFAAALLRVVSGAERWAFSDLIAAHERLSGRMRERDPRHLQATNGWIDRARLLDAMYHAIADHRPRLAIITGLRKRDEVALVKGMGGRVVRIVRTLPDGSRYVSPDRDPNHPIEQDIDSLVADVTIEAETVEALTEHALEFSRAF